MCNANGLSTSVYTRASARLRPLIRRIESLHRVIRERVGASVRVQLKCQASECLEQLSSVRRVKLLDAAETADAKSGEGIRFGVLEYLWGEGRVAP